MSAFVRGYAFCPAKLAVKYGTNPDEISLISAMQVFKEMISREAYSRTQVGHQVSGGVTPNENNWSWVLVIDEGPDATELEARPLPALHKDINKFMFTLEGPHVYKAHTTN